MAKPYEAVFARWGFRPVVGARVEHQATGEKGTILKERPERPDLVHVQFDLCSAASLCHPSDLDFHAPEASAEAIGRD